MKTNNTSRPLVFAHIGDLHINTAREQNYIDLLSMLAQIEMNCAKQLDFIYIPGDIADHGTAFQYQLVSNALKIASNPVHIIPGDHDMEQGSLDAFYEILQQDNLPKYFTVNGCRCLFIDSSGPGKGGPDFRIGNKQLAWLADELQLAESRQETKLLFMHTYPDDLADKNEKLAIISLVAKYKVTLVDIGHTHYNELANDGHTIFAATRSTGQIEEGPVGYSLISVDNGIVSWRFKQLQDPFPFVLITSPADTRLTTREHELDPGPTELRAMIFSPAELQGVHYQIENERQLPMEYDEVTKTWYASIERPAAGHCNITVEAIDGNGWPGRHTITIAAADHSFRDIVQNGSDTASIGAWPENHIFGTQLGPNRNAKPSH